MTQKLFESTRHNTPTFPSTNEEREDIVCATRKRGITCDVGSSHPGAGEGPKGPAVRRLKWYVSWVQNVDKTALRRSNALSRIGLYRGSPPQGSNALKGNPEGRFGSWMQERWPLQWCWAMATWNLMEKRRAFV